MLNHATTLHEALKVLVSCHGDKILEDPGVVDLLENKYNGLRGLNTLECMIKDGIATQVLDDYTWSSEVKKKLRDYAESHSMNDGLVLYLAQCLLFAIGAINEIQDCGSTRMSKSHDVSVYFKENEVIDHCEIVNEKDATIDIEEFRLIPWFKNEYGFKFKIKGRIGLPNDGYRLSAHFYNQEREEAPTYMFWNKTDCVGFVDEDLDVLISKKCFNTRTADLVEFSVEPYRFNTIYESKKNSSRFEDVAFCAACNIYDTAKSLHSGKITFDEAQDVLRDYSVDLDRTDLFNNNDYCDLSSDAYGLSMDVLKFTLSEYDQSALEQLIATSRKVMRNAYYWFICQ